MSLSQTTGVGVDKGQLVADAAVLAGPAVLRDGAEWGEVTVTCTVRADVIAAGLLVRASSSGRDGLLVEADQSGVVTLSRVADGAVTQVAKSSRTDGFNKTKFHSLAVSLRGPDCSVTLDGKDKGTVTDDTLTRGGVGVYARDGQRSLWEDLTVTGADGGTLYTQVFDDPAAAGDFTARDMPESAPRPAAATARPAGCKDGGELVELTEQADGGSWRVPEGRWQIDLFGGVDLVDNTSGYIRGYTDLLDDEPVELFLDIVPGEYHRRFGRYFGNVIKGFWDDEPFIASAGPHPFKRRPWSPTLAGCPRRDRGRTGRRVRERLRRPGRAGPGVARPVLAGRLRPVLALLPEAGGAVRRVGRTPGHQPAVRRGGPVQAHRLHR